MEANVRLKRSFVFTFIFLFALCFFLFFFFEEHFNSRFFVPTDHQIFEITDTTKPQNQTTTTSVTPPLPVHNAPIDYSPTDQTFRSAASKIKVFDQYSTKGLKVSFIHVHKAGGTSIRVFLKKLERKKHVETDAIESYSTIWRGWGSSMYDWMKKNEEERLFMIAFRHPIERLLSQYDFEVRFGCQVCDRPDSLLWRISMEKYFEEIGRGYDRQLKDVYKPFQGPHAQNHYVKLLTCYKDWNCTVDESNLELAKKVVNSFDLVLVTEWLDDPRSLLMTKTILQVDFSTEHKRGHGSNRVNALSPKLRRKMEEMNKWDIILYEYVKELVFERMQNFVEDNTLQERDYHELLRTEQAWRIEPEESEKRRNSVNGTEERLLRF